MRPVFRQFKPALSVSLGEGVDLMVTEAGRDGSGGMRAVVEAWNGVQLHANKLDLAADRQRREFTRRLGQALPEATKERVEPGIQKALLALSQQVTKCLDEAAAAAENALPRINLSERELHAIGDDVLRVLETDNRDETGSPCLYVRAGALARVLVNDRDRPAIQWLAPAALRRRMSETARFCRTDKHGMPSVAWPPREMVEDLLARGDWPFPPLEAIVESPVLRPDGTVLDAPGYDPATGLFYRPQPCFDWPGVSALPGPADRAAARALIQELIEGFPFVDDPDRANAIGAGLTLVMRPAIAGCVPLALFDAPTPGTGKGRLVEAFSLLGMGQAAPLMSQVSSEEEWRKQITTVLLSGGSLIVLDNVTAPLASSQLAKALTARIWRDRLLGTNKSADLPIRATWIATGNNLQLGGDLPRRCYWVRLDAHTAEPWLRTEFKHPDLLGWVRENRGRLLAALLTLARAWYAAGCPAASAPLLGSFEEWSRIVGGVLAHAGIKGFLDNLKQMHEQTAEAGASWEGFLMELSRALNGTSATSRDIAALVCTDEALRLALPDALLAALARSRDAFTLALGQALPRQAEVRRGRLRVVRAGQNTDRKAPLWKVVTEDDTSPGGLSL